MTFKPLISLSVRELVEFVCRSGDLGAGSGFTGRNRALEGTRGHQRLQKKRPTGYQPEVPIRFQIEQPDFIFELKGRIDGIFITHNSLLIEEIKTTRRPWTGPAETLHWAQAKIYGCLYAREHNFAKATIRITYVELSSAETVEFHETFSLDTLEQFFESVLTEYLTWLREHRLWCEQRNASIQSLAFPFKEYRKGQRQLAVAVYRAAKSRAKLFAEAPTGIGKTVSVLFPVIKAMGENHLEKIFYLTARTIGRTVAQDTVTSLRRAGLRLRAVTLTAREKICFNNGQPCDLGACPFAIGYYDRIKAALRDALQSDSFTRLEIEAIARRHSVCPFELSLDLSLWADVIICDYNYVFDPSVSLKRFFDDELHDYAILVDEAHNLVDRARDMFSADLQREEILGLKKALAEQLPTCAKALNKIATRFRRFEDEEGWVPREGALVSKSVPENFAPLLDKFLDQAELWLAREEQSRFREDLLNLYFRILTFQRVLEMYDDRYITLYERDTMRLRLFCLDPSALLRRALKKTGPSIFFSATLRPLEYFREALGGDPIDSVLHLASPFPSQNLSIFVHDRIATRLTARSGSYDVVADSIAQVVGSKTGNYLVFFSSYAYMTEVFERFRARAPDTRVAVQNTGMSEAERENFVANFCAKAEQTLVAFALLGGLFGEGIDLLGDRLIGVVVVGVGLPQICLERELIKETFQQKARNGFDYAYTFPGMNRVLQAAGRVIRSENDRGIVLLIDERFEQSRYRRLFPEWWRTRTIRSSSEIHSAALQFWQEPLVAPSSHQS
jgi:DNA excision repair protein ERCC-2